jgi:AAT family amino acid transporter
LFWVFLVSVNAAHVKAYGEMGWHWPLFVNMARLTDYRFALRVKSEYWLSSLKVVAIVLFIIGGVLVNVGVNREHRFIGWSNWHIPGAPFVGGFGGFAKVFVTASFACKSSISGFGVVEVAHMLTILCQMAGQKVWVSLLVKPGIHRAICRG